MGSRLRTFAEIPNRNITDADHQNFYLPALAADNKVWFTNNLIAIYSNPVRVSYYPTKQASSPNDTHAYESSFQGVD